MARHRAEAPTTLKGAALHRALATLWTNVGIDAAVAIGVGLGILLGTLEVTTAEFWAGLRVLVLRSVLTSVANYFIRLKKPGKTDVAAIEGQIG